MQKCDKHHILGYIVQFCIGECVSEIDSNSAGLIFLDLLSGSGFIIDQSLMLS